MDQHTRAPFAVTNLENFWTSKNCRIFKQQLGLLGRMIKGLPSSTTFFDLSFCTMLNDMNPFKLLYWKVDQKLTPRFWVVFQPSGFSKLKINVYVHKETFVGSNQCQINLMLFEKCNHKRDTFFYFIFYDECILPMQLYEFLF